MNTAVTGTLSSQAACFPGEIPHKAVGNLEQQTFMQGDTMPSVPQGKEPGTGGVSEPMDTTALRGKERDQLPDTALLRRYADRGNGIFWDDFTVSPRGAEMVARYGPGAAQEAFERLSGDGYLTAVDAHLSRAASGCSPIDRELADYAKTDLIEDAALRRIAPPKLKTLQQEIAQEGLAGRPTVTGYVYDNENETTAVTEMRIEQLNRGDCDRLLSSPGLRESITRFFGRSSDWESLHREFDGTDRVLTISRDPARPAPVPAPLDIPADFITHHNQALESWEAAKAAGIISTGNILVHLDSHSDIYTTPTSVVSIANFVNSSLADGTVSEVYWVVPDTMTPNSRGHQGPLGMTAEPGYDVNLHVIDGCVVPDRPAPGTPSREVTVHVRRMNQVPADALAEARRSGTGVLLDVDLDYFSNSGHDSAGGTVHNPGRSELYGSLERFALFAERLGPSFVTSCMSPEYTCRDDRETLRSFVGALFPRNLIADGPGSYRLRHNVTYDMRLLDMLKETALPDTREFSSTLRDEMRARGFSGLASSYEHYCQGKIGRATFLGYVNRAMQAQGLSGGQESMVS